MVSLVSVLVMEFFFFSGVNLFIDSCQEIFFNRLTKKHEVYTSCISHHIVSIEINFTQKIILNYIKTNVFKNILTVGKFGKNVFI